MKTPRIQVIKVGGSLFDLDDLGERIRGYICDPRMAGRGIAEPKSTKTKIVGWRSPEQECFPANFDHTVLIAGGGALVDVVRRADRRFRFAKSKSHWLSIRAMRSTARFLAEKLTEVAVVDDFSRLRERTNTRGVTIFDSYSFLREDEPGLPGRTLPSSWDVTSDSIAARLAIVLSAEELVLLKSVSPSTGLVNLNGLRNESVVPGDRIEAPLVDEYFSNIACELQSVQIVNLRNSSGQSEIDLKLADETKKAPAC